MYWNAMDYFTRSTEKLRPCHLETVTTKKKGWPNLGTNALWCKAIQKQNSLRNTCITVTKYLNLEYFVQIYKNTTYSKDNMSKGYNRQFI